MMLVGVSDCKKKARLFCTYLDSLNIAAKCSERAGQFEVWVERQEHLEQAKTAWGEFEGNPSDRKFQQRRDKSTERAAARALQASYRRHFRPLGRGSILTVCLMVVCICCYILINTGFKRYLLVYLTMFAPRGLPAMLITEPWRLVTPIFLHFSLLHIAFNMYWLYCLGSLIEKQDRVGCYVVLLLLSAVVSNLAQWYMTGPLFGGMSGVVYALFAYIWISAKFNPMSGYWISQDIVLLMLAWLVLCFTGWVGPIGNYAHLAGLLCGAAFAGLRTCCR